MSKNETILAITQLLLTLDLTTLKAFYKTLVRIIEERSKVNGL